MQEKGNFAFLFAIAVLFISATMNGCSSQPRPEELYSSAMEHFDRKEWSLAAIGFQNYVQLADQSDWGREKTAQGYWHLAASKFAAGEQQQALESSLAGYYRYPIDEVYANQVIRIAK